MESEGQALDESKLDLAISDLLQQEQPKAPVKADVNPQAETTYADLSEAEELAEEDTDTVIGFTASLKQKWAELVGAA